MAKEKEGAAEERATGAVAPRVKWDAAGMKVTNEPEANKLLHYAYRDGWTL